MWIAHGLQFGYFYTDFAELKIQADKASHRCKALSVWLPNSDKSGHWNITIAI